MIMFKNKEKMTFGLHLIIVFVREQPFNFKLQGEVWGKSGFRIIFLGPLLE